MLSFLTCRERQIVDLLAKGFRNSEIARHLKISPSTVENHLHKIYIKLKARNRTEVTQRYWESAIRSTL